MKSVPTVAFWGAVGPQIRHQFDGRDGGSRRRTRVRSEWKLKTSPLNGFCLTMGAASTIAY